MSRRPANRGDAHAARDRLRLIVAGVLLAVLSIYVLADAFEFPGLRAGFHVDGTVVGGLLGGIAAMLIPEIASRLPGIKPRPTDEDALDG